MVDALTLPASVGREEAHFAVVKGLRSGLQTKFHALRLYGRKVLSLPFLKVSGAACENSAQQNVAHIHPLSARTLAQEA